MKSYVEQVTPIVNKGLALGYRLATGKDAFLTAQVLHYARLACIVPFTCSIFMRVSCMLPSTMCART